MHPPITQKQGAEMPDKSAGRNKFVALKKRIRLFLKEFVFVSFEWDKPRMLLTVFSPSERWCNVNLGDINRLESPHRITSFIPGSPTRLRLEAFYYECYRRKSFRVARRDTKIVS